MANFPLSAQPSPYDDRDFKAEYIFKYDSVPEIYDPRKYMLPLRFQGGQGSCLAMACSVNKEWQENKNIGYRFYFSPQFIYNLRENKDGYGMYPRDAMKILNKQGIVPEDKFPYSEKIGGPETIGEDLLKEASNYKTFGYAIVETIDMLKFSIYKNGPAIGCFPVYNYGDNFWKSDVNDLKPLGYHACAVIGWNKDGFILSNSWGRYNVFPYSDWDYKTEIWTTIDDSTSKPDPTYTRLHWKLYRWLKNIFSIKKGRAASYLFTLGSLMFFVTHFLTNEMNYLYLGLLATLSSIVFYIKKGWYL